MKRDPRTLGDDTFDVVIVGGGINGACIAWDAALRGLSVALLEQGDFGSGASAHNQRTVHGGFRYLQNADMRRLRESVRERRYLMRAAPHLVRPLPFLIPTYKTGIQHKELMRSALALYDLIAIDRNRGIRDRSRRLPRGRIVSREECLRLAPGLEARGVTGGAVWYDGQFRNPDRLTLAFVRSAAARGACVANYMRVSGFIRRGHRVVGVRAVDLLGGSDLDVRGQLVISAVGPWSTELLGLLRGRERGTRQVKSMNLLTRSLTRDGHGLSVMVPHCASADGRHDSCCLRYFFVPWRGSTIAGSLDVIHDGGAGDCQVSDEELEKLVARINAAYPGAELRPEETDRVHVGLLPLSERGPQDDPYNAARHYRIVDHAVEDRVEGVVSVVGVKFTTARDVAEKAVGLCMHKMGTPRSRSSTASTPLYGGDIPDFGRLTNGLLRERPLGLAEDVLRQLADNYGSAHNDLLACLSESSERREPVGDTVLQGQVVYAVREEMAQKLSDVVLRRTELGSLRHPGRVVLRACARAMASELGWSDARVAAELAETEAELARVRALPHS